MATDTIPAVEPEPVEARATHRRRWIIALVLVAAVAGLVLWALWPERGQDVRAGTTAVASQELADRYGMDVTLVGVSAAGGMIDFRFIVVDPDKADAVLHDLDLYPKFVNENTGATVVMQTLPHSHDRTISLGEHYFFLLPNASNALRPGDLVTLVIGDVRLEHVPVQG